jgi:flavin reductase (DIM6/NTAB) family NADH-FMN oxidoreductase RutF
MKKLILFSLFVCFVFTSLQAQNYDSVSGATQKENGEKMNLEQFKKALVTERTLVFSTVNADGTPNAAVFASFINIEENVFAVNSIADTKTTKMNLKQNKIAMLIMVLPEKTADGFDGAKVVLKYIDDKDKIAAYRSKMEKSSENTTFFTVEKFLIYH